MNNYIGILKQMKKMTLHRLDVSLLSCVCVCVYVCVRVGGGGGCGGVVCVCVCLCIMHMVSVVACSAPVQFHYYRIHIVQT